MISFKIIHLNKGLNAIVDVEDYDWLSKYNWGFYKTNNNSFYAVRYTNINNKLIKIHMHREILEKYGFDLIDSKVTHINNNQLDNRLKNLKVTINSKKDTGFKGIFYEKSKNKWRTQIRYIENGITKTKKSGGFNNAIDAAKKYNELALKYHGELASLNFIPEE